MLTPAIALGALHVLGLDIADNVEAPAASSAAPPSPAEAGAKQKLERLRANARRLPFRQWSSGGSGGGLFDAMICDPPYGLRKPRMLSGGSKDAPVQNATEMQAAVAAAMAPVVNFAAGPAGLVPKGRLVFLFPSFDFTEAKGKGTRAAEANAIKAANAAAAAVAATEDARPAALDPSPTADSADSTAARAQAAVRTADSNGSVRPPMIPGQDGYDALVAAVPRHPGLRLVSICAQEFKGMTRHAVVMARGPP